MLHNGQYLTICIKIVQCRWSLHILPRWELTVLKIVHLMLAMSEKNNKIKNLYEYQLDSTSHLLNKFKSNYEENLQLYQRTRLRALNKDLRN